MRGREWKGCEEGMGGNEKEGESGRVDGRKIIREERREEGRKEREGKDKKERERGRNRESNDWGKKRGGERGNKGQRWIMSFVWFRVPLFSLEQQSVQKLTNYDKTDGKWNGNVDR